MAFDYEGALAEGYTPAEIADFLGKQKKFDIAGARKEGYSDFEIITHLTEPTVTAAPTLSKQKEGFLPSLKEGAVGAYEATKRGVTAPFQSEEAIRADYAKQAAEAEARNVGYTPFSAIPEAYEKEGLGAAAATTYKAARDALGRSIPYMAPTLGGAATGARLLAPLGPVGVGAGAILGGIAGSVPQFAGTNIERRIQEKTPGPLVTPEVYGTAAGQAALDTAATMFTLGTGLVAKVVGRPIAQVSEQQLLRTAERSLTGTVGRGAGRGAISEMPTEVAQQILERKQAGLDLTSEDAYREYGEAAAAAGVLGGAFGGVGNIVTRGQARARTEELERQRQAELDAITQERQRIASIAATAAREEQARLLAADEALKAREAELRVPLTTQMELELAPETTVEEVAARRAAATPQGDLFVEPGAAPVEAAPAPTLDEDTIKSFGFRKNTIPYKAMQSLENPAIPLDEKMKRFDQIIENNQDKIKTKEQEAAIDTFKRFMTEQKTKEAQDELTGTGAYEGAGGAGLRAISERGRAGVAPVAEEPITAPVDSTGADVGLPAGGAEPEYAALAPEAQAPEATEVITEPEAPTVQRITPEERQQRIIEQRAAEEEARRVEREANLAAAKAEQAGFRVPSEFLPAESEGLQAYRESKEGVDDVDMSQRMERGIGSTPSQIESALQDWYVDPTATKQAAEIVSDAKALPPDVSYAMLRSANRKGVSTDNVQAFTHNGKAYLIADRIKPGTERSVFMHEVGAHMGLKRGEINTIANKINKWADAKEGSIEREVYDAVQRRMESAKELANEELVAYTVEEAANRGVTPQAVLRAKSAPPNTVASLIRYIAEKFLESARKAFGAYTSTPTAQDLVDYIYGSTRKVLQEGPTQLEMPEAGWSDKRINSLMSSYAYANDDTKTKAFAVMMSPQQFLDITSDKETQRDLKKETKPLDESKLAGEFQDIFLHIDPTNDPNKFEVSGHEGRHRMIALARAGVKEVPVVLDMRRGENVKPLDVAYLAAQTEGWMRGEGTQGAFVGNLVPINYENLPALKERFGKGDIRFSVADTPTGDNISRDLASPRVAAARLNLGAKVKEITPKLLSMYQLVDQFGNDMPALRNYAELNDRMTMTQQRLKNKAHEVLSDWGQFANRNGKANDKLSKLMMDATRTRIHPDEEFDSEANAHLTDDMKEKYEELSNAYNSLPNEAKAIYQKSRALLQENFELRRTVYNDMVKESYADELEGATPEEAEKINKRIEKSIQEHEILLNQMRGPYFPLMRFGDYLVIAESPELRALRDEKEGATGEERKRINGLIRQMEQQDEHYQVHAAEKRSEQAAIAKELAAKGMRVRESKAEEYMSNLRQSSFAAVDQLQQIFDKEYALDIKDEDMKQLRLAMIDTILAGLPENSALQRQIKRRNIAGAEKNMMRAFAEATERDSFYISRLGFMKPLSNELIDMKEQSKDDMQLRDVYNNVRSRLNMDVKYDHHPILSKLTGFSSIYHLGIAPSYLLTNMTQPFAITMPQLAGEYGASKASRALISSWKEAYKAVQGGRNGKFFSLKDTDLGKVFKGDELKMVQTLQDLGKLDIANNMDTEVYTKGMSPRTIKFWQMFNWASHNIELMNRLSTALAAFKLEKASPGGTFEKAMNKAREAVELTQLDYSDTNAAYFMKQGLMGGLNRIPMQFRKYQQGMIYLLARNFKNAWGGDKAAKKAFLYLMGTQLMMAGVRGVPIAAPLLFLLGAFGDEDDPEGDLETQLRNSLADTFGADTARVFWKGLPAMLGVDSGSLSMENLFLPFPMMRASAITDAATGKDAVTELMFNLGGAPVSMASKVMDSYLLASEGDYQKALEKAMPKFISSLIKAERLGSEGLTTKAGNVAIEADEFTAWDQALKALGFSPTLESEYYQAMYEKERISDAIDKRRNKIIKAIATARLAGEDVSDLLQQANEFNTEHPSRRIDGESIRRSVAQRRKDKMERSESGVRFTKRERDIRDVTRFAE